jgi:hypothetical protein
MADNRSYLDRFHEEIKNQRFAMIVSETLFVQTKGRAEAFGEENDAWVREVSAPVLCYYQPFRRFRTARLQLLTPVEDPAPCQ